MHPLCFRILLHLAEKVNYNLSKEEAPHACPVWPLPRVALVLTFITPLHFSNTEFLVYPITYYEISYLLSFSHAYCFYLEFSPFLTYLLSSYLSCEAQLRRLLLSEAFFLPFGTELISLSFRLPLYFINILIITFFSFNCNHLFTYFFLHQIMSSLKQISCSSSCPHHLAQALVLNKDLK